MLVLSFDPRNDSWTGSSTANIAYNETNSIMGQVDYSIDASTITLSLEYEQLTLQLTKDRGGFWWKLLFVLTMVPLVAVKIVGELDMIPNNILLFQLVLLGARLAMSGLAGL